MEKENTAFHSKRKNINTTLDEHLYKEVRKLALDLDVNANDLIEEGMRYILKKYASERPI